VFHWAISAPGHPKQKRHYRRDAVGRGRLEYAAEPRKGSEPRIAMRATACPNAGAVINARAARAAILSLCKSRLFASILVLVSGRVMQNMRCISKGATNFKSLASTSSATSAFYRLIRYLALFEAAWNAVRTKKTCLSIVEARHKAKRLAGFSESEAGGATSCCSRRRWRLRCETRPCRRAALSAWMP
jgi:hypothetical protein